VSLEEVEASIRETARSNPTSLGRQRDEATRAIHANRALLGDSAPPAA
jgi:hypothetical protein